MYTRFQETLKQIDRDGQHGLLADGTIGLEKESLRVDVAGMISQKPHPSALGSALTNPHITTDYSEALLEFITPPLPGVPAAMNFLEKIHQFVYQHLEEELLWNASMPCVVTGDNGIPIANYGNSNLGLMKTVYRRGLGYRYGKMMQVIAGIHFNYSIHENFWPYFRELKNQQHIPLQDFISEQYFGLIRNLQRFGWINFYLFGASPAICESFLQGQPNKLEKFNDKTYYLPYATTLRMGDIGYTNKKENEFGVKACYDNLASYINCLTEAIETPCPEFEKVGIKVDGEYRQLNANILQIENEYYSSVRPKQPLVNNEKPTHALHKRGVQYIELRSLDLNMFEPLGMTVNQLNFLETLMIFCLLHESPAIDKDERISIDENDDKAAHQGRDPALVLQRKADTLSLQAWGKELLQEMQPLCELLDRNQDERLYSDALDAQMALFEEVERTPSARMLEEMQGSGDGFFPNC